MDESVRLHIFISGRVQGVFFRSNTKRLAKELGLAGWVRNLPDGRVEAVFEGQRDKVSKIVEWCWKGPPAAKVSKVDFKEEKVENLSGFKKQ